MSEHKQSGIGGWLSMRRECGSYSNEVLPHASMS